MGSYNFALEKVEDEGLRQVLERLTAVIQDNVFLDFRGKHLKLELEGGTFLLPHYLGYVPRDTFVTSALASSGTVTVAFNYSLFTKTHFSVTVTLSVPTATASVRAFMGRMREEGL